MRHDVIDSKLMQIATILDDLTAAVVALAGEFADEAKKETERTNPRAEEKKEEPEKKYTFEEVRKALAAKSSAGFTNQVRELLQKHGASKLSEIEEGEYAALMEEVQDIGSTQ